MQYLIVLFIIGYLIGSINVSVIISKYVGKYDITKVGSGNAGGTNIARTMGAKWGIVVILIEIAKATLFGLAARWFFPADILNWGVNGALFSGVIAVFGCFIGNRFPCFHKFKGGKGVTVGAALAIVVDWRVFLILILLFAIIFLVTHIVSVGSVIAALGIPICTFIMYVSEPYCIYPVIGTAIVSIGIAVNHSQNIKRLINGTENRFEFGAKKKEKK